MANNNLTRLPPLEYQQYQIDLQISIWRQNERFTAYVQSTGNTCFKIPIELTSNELQSLNETMQTMIGEVSISRDKDNAVLRLAEIGNAAYKTVFKDEKARKTIEAAILSVPPHGVIQITSDDFVIPWDLLFDHEVTSNVSCDDFWGMRYIISRVRVVASRPGDFVSPIVYLPRPKIGLLVNKSLPFVRDQEMPFFTGLHDSGKVNLVTLHSLDPQHRITGIQEFIQFWKEDLDVAHLACHAIADKNPTNSRIVLSDNFKITLQDMTVYNLVINNNPLVVLNGCRTGNLDPLYVSSIADTFIEYGARGVIATEYAVPDQVAATFTKHLYENLLAGKNLGVSLMNTRRKMLEEYDSPVGLLYALYAPPNYQIVKE